MKKRPTILIFDSGLGGLTVFTEIYQQLPKARYLYLCDNHFFPYSEKKSEDLERRAVAIVQKITTIIPLDLLVIACNTASTVVLPTLRKNFSYQIIGTVPAIKPAALISESKKIALIATVGTINRPYTHDLIKQYHNGCEFTLLGSTTLVELAEKKLKGQAIDQDHIEKIVQHLRNNNIDTVVLGCTHFPLLREELSKALPEIRSWVDSGKAIANRVRELLAHKIIDTPVYSNLSQPTKDSAENDAKNIAFLTASTDYEDLSQVMKQFHFDETKILS